MSTTDITKPSKEPNSFLNCKGMLELVGIYSDDVKDLNANYRKWALKYHPDKGFGEKDFFALVTDCVRSCAEYLERCHKDVVDGFETVPSINELRDQDKIKFTDDLGVVVYGVVLQMHPLWSTDKTHIVMCKTNAKWEPDMQANKMFVCKESAHNTQRLRKGDVTTSPTLGIMFEDVQWRDLKAGDKIFVTYVNVKNPTVTLTAHGIFRSAPTYSDVVEFVKTDESFNTLSRAVTVLPLTGSRCRFKRVTNKQTPLYTSTPKPPTPPPPAAAPATSPFFANGVPTATPTTMPTPTATSTPSMQQMPFTPTTPFQWTTGSCATPVPSAHSKKRKVL